MARPKDAAKQVNDHNLCHHENGNSKNDNFPILQDHGKVQRKADRDKEQTQENAAKWLDIGFKFVPVRRFSQQDPCNERAHGHRKACGLEQTCRPKDDKERCGNHHFAGTGVGDDPEHGIDEITSCNHQRCNGRDSSGEMKTRAGL